MKFYSNDNLGGENLGEFSIYKILEWVMDKLSRIFDLL